MPMLDGIRNLFRGRKEPVAIDLSDEDRLHAEVVDHGGADGNALVAERRPKRSMAELQQGYEEVMGLVRRVGDHLDAQAKRTEKLLTLMERMPQALDALPEINRQNARLLEAISEHLSQSKNRETALNDTLRSLGESSSQQTEVLGLLQRQFDISTQSAEKMTETLGNFSEALSNLAATNNRSTDVLSRIVDAADERESRMASMVSRSERWNWVIVGLLSLGVLILAIIGIGLLR